MKDQKFKIGDTLICKLNGRLLINGKSYIICDIVSNNLFSDKKDFTYYIGTGSELLSFWQEFLLYEYFYSKKEERKMKLERLNIL